MPQNTQAIILVLATLVGASLLLGSQAIFWYLRARRKAEFDRIQDRLGVARQQDDEEAIAALLREQAADQAIDVMGGIGEGLQTTIAQSGLKMSVTELMVQVGVAFLVGSTGGFALGGFRGVALGLIFAYLPIARVSRAATQRADKILDQMPDALEMMGRAMQAGAGLSDCFRMAGDELQAPLSEEFGRVADEVKYGKDWRTTLLELVDRNPSLFELRLLVSSLLLQRDTGGNMIETMTRVSHLIRVRFAFDMKVRAMTGEARASGFVLMVMPIGVAVLVFMTNPAYLTPLWTHPIGQVFMVYAVGSYSVGIFAMNVASTVEV